MHILSCLLNIITYCLVDIWFSKIILAYLLYATFASSLACYMVLQVLADKFGNVVHFGERDCSIQVPEAPSFLLFLGQFVKMVLECSLNSAMKMDFVS